MPRIVHFEIPADDVARATDFYSNVFGWNFSAFGGDDYQLAQTGEGEGIDGAIMKKRDHEQPVTNSIGVDSIDNYTEKITSAGGQIVVPKMEISGVGYLAYFKDTEGNIHGLWENLPSE